jgi:hypothetical protein
MKSEKTNWTNWYIAVLAFLALQIVFYYLFTQYWS